jgi:hypothetical protein
VFLSERADLAAAEAKAICYGEKGGLDKFKTKVGAFPTAHSYKLSFLEPIQSAGLLH